jgi:hypothetical protein
MEKTPLQSYLSHNDAKEMLETGKLPDDFTKPENVKLMAEMILLEPCINCDDRKCMGCIFREYYHDCADDCGFCC